ncbi:MAG: hypothetical protein ACQEXB_00895 [Bacillota bacterium]
MSIKQYYFRAAQSYLQGFIAAITLFTLLLIFGLLLPSRPPLGLLFIPFTLFAVVQFQGYLRYRKRALEALFVRLDEDLDDFFSYSDYLLTFAPAPALRLLLFHPNSLLAGEILELNQKVWRYLLPNVLDRRLKKTFGLYDSRGNLLAYFIAMNQRVEVMDVDKNVVMVYDHHKQLGTADETGVKFTRSSHSSVYTDVRLVREERVVSRLQKGWMPTKWTKHFTINTPILSFDISSNQTDKLLTLAAVISHYQYENH